MRLGLKRVEGKELGMDRGKVLIKTGVLGRPQRGIWGEGGLHSGLRRLCTRTSCQYSVDEETSEKCKLYEYDTVHRTSDF